MKKKALIIFPLLVVIIVFVGVFIYYNREDAKTSLTVNEKKWVLENDTKILNKLFFSKLELLFFHFVTIYHRLRKKRDYSPLFFIVIN